mgnify:CR=1 FL=1
MAKDETILVETVDDQGRAIGSAEKLQVHREPGTLHRAFSLFAFDDEGRLLLQRRAAGKYHSPLLLTNSTCGHPFPGEAPAAGVARRHQDELGLYEHEYNHVFAGRVDPDALVPEPSEVDEVLFVTAQDLARLRAAEPFTAWFDQVWQLVLPRVAEWGFSAR